MPDPKDLIHLRAIGTNLDNPDSVHNIFFMFQPSTGEVVVMDKVNWLKFTAWGTANFPNHTFSQQDEAACDVAFDYAKKMVTDPAVTHFSNTNVKSVMSTMAGLVTATPWKESWF